MAYLSRDAFLKDFHKAATAAAQEYGKFYTTVSDDVAWAAYSNASKKTDPDSATLGLMLFGRHLVSMRGEVRKLADEAFQARQKVINDRDAKLKKNYLVPKFIRKAITSSATNKNIAKLERDKESVPAAIDPKPESTMVKNFGIVNNQTSGSILLMGCKLWNFTINDTWVLGAVHSHLPFYPASSVSRANIFDSKHVLSITGRELFGLALFGYRQIIPEHAEVIGTAFEPADTKKADAATLERYQAEMTNLTLTKAQQVFKDAGFRIVEVGL